MTPTLALLYALTIGYQPISETVVADTWEVHNDCYTLQLDLELRLIDLLYVGGSVRTDMDFMGISKYGAMSPYQAFYTIDAGLMFKADDVKVRVGLFHECDHPIEVLTAGKVVAGNLYAGRTVIYLKVGNL